MSDKITTTVEQKQLKITNESVKELSDEELDKVAGGCSSSCPDPACVFRNNTCECPDNDEDDW